MAGTALTAAVVVGPLFGGAARIMMRLVALSEGRDREFTWSGSLGICFGGLVFSVIAASIVVGVRAFHRKIGRVATAVLTLFLTAFAGGELFAVESGRVTSAGRLAAIVAVRAAFTLVFLAYGVALWRAIEWLDVQSKSRSAQIAVSR